MSASDHDLLREYALNCSEPAFAELVRRHLDLVYSAAKRHVQSSALAEEIAQSVFLDLSRHANRLNASTPLVAWLHLVTRRTAIDALRRETRRQIREQTAVEIVSMKSTPSIWSQVEPLLDEALANLNQTDRSAILLRYFENKSLREISDVLGASEYAAQKRVSRAIERLRTFLVRRGVTVTAAGLVTDLSAHATQTAPASLGTTITTLTASKMAAAITLSPTAQLVTMTTAQKILITTTLALAITGGVFEAFVISRQNEELQALREQTEAYRRELRGLHAEHTRNADRLAALAEQLAGADMKASAFASADPAAESALEAWIGRVRQLKQQLEQMPQRRIPEMKYLMDDDWLSAVKDAKLDTELDVREALSRLRNHAQNRVAASVSKALRSYVKANNSRLPNDATQLAPFFDLPVDLAMLQRYEMLVTGSVDDAQDGKWVLRAKPVDDYQDTLMLVGATGGYGFQSESLAGQQVSQALQSFQRANGGQTTNDPARLAPYLKSPVEPAVIKKLVQTWKEWKE